MKNITWKDIVEVCNLLGFPNEALADLEKCYNLMMPQYADRLQGMAKEWMDVEGDWQKCLRELSTISQETNGFLNGIRMVFFLYCAIPLRQEYEKRGLSEDLYFETLQDL